jgi:hypothetical protein
VSKEIMVDSEGSIPPMDDSKDFRCAGKLCNTSRVDMVHRGLGKIFHYAIVLGFPSIQIVGGPSKYPFGRVDGRFKSHFSNMRGPVGGEVGGGSFDEGSSSMES